MALKQHTTANTLDHQKLPHTIGIQDLEEAIRNAAVQECLYQHNIDPESDDQIGDFLESILILQSGVRSAPLLTSKNKSQISKKEDPVLSGQSIDKLYLKSNKAATCSISVTSQVQSKTMLQSTEDQSSPKGYLIASKEEILKTAVEGVATLDLDTRSVTSSSSSLSPPPAIILTPDSWSMAGGDTVVAQSPTMERLEMMARFDDADWSYFNALKVVARVAEEEWKDPNAQMTMEKLEAAGVLLELGGQASESPKTSHTMAIDHEVYATSEVNGHPITPTHTVKKEEIMKKMEDQSRRSGLTLSRALGAPVTPSSIDQYLFSPNRKLFQDTLYNKSPLAPKKDIDKKSGVTLDNTIWQSGIDSEMRPDEKRKKPVQHQFSGPPDYLLDPNRNDPIAMAARNNHPGDLDDFPSILAGTKPNLSYHASEPKRQPTSTLRAKDEYPDFQGSSGFTKSKECTPPSRQKTYQFGGGDGLWEEGKHSEEHFTRQAELDKLKAERKIRDDNEMFAGLQAFKGNQRGWNGEHETDRQKTLARYFADGDQRIREEIEKVVAKDIAEKEKPMQKGKASTSPLDQRPEPSYKGMKKEKVIAAKGKHLEEAYSERYAKVVQENQDNDDFIDRLEKQNQKEMIKRPWDIDQIKREALEEQRVNANETLRAKVVENELKRKETHADGRIDAEQQKKLRTSEL